MISNIFQKLITKPSALALAWFMGLGFFGFLLLFKPFQIYPYESSTGHGIIQRTLVYGFWAFWVFRLFGEDILGLYLRRASQIFLVVLFCFFTLNYFWGGRDWTWNVFLEMLWQVATLCLFLLFLFPILKTALIKGSVSKGFPKDQFIRVMAENGKDFLELRKEDFFFAKSDGNYLEIYHTKGEALQRKLIRKSLKSLEKDWISERKLVRVHKQYLVNLSTLKGIDRSSGSLLLEYTEGLKVPVGKAYLEAFEKQWQIVAPK